MAEGKKGPFPFSQHGVNHGASKIRGGGAQPHMKGTSNFKKY